MNGPFTLQNYGHENPPVLANRPLRDDVDPAQVSRFEDEVWDFAAGLLDNHSTSVTYRFDVFPEAWRPFAKRYVWTLINHDAPANVYASGAPRLSLRSITHSRAALNRVLTWFDSVGLFDLQSVNESDYERLLAHILASGLTRDAAGDVLLEVRRMWSYRALLDPQHQLPAGVPWYGATNQDLLGRAKSGPENRTPRIADETIHGLVVWASRMVEDLAPDIVRAYHEWEEYSHGPLSEPTGPLQVSGTRQERVARTLELLRGAGRGIPCIRNEEQPRINWAHLGRLAHARGTSIQRWDTNIIESSGLRYDDATYLLMTPTGKLDGVNWRPNGIEYHEAPILAERLMTAAFILISYLSGMRPGEALNLRRGCCTFDETESLWMVKGLHFKGVRDEAGQHDPAGALRGEPWTVHELVAKAISALEQLHSESLLFPRKMMRLARPDVTRLGEAITTAQSASAIGRFVEWVNGFCDETKRQDSIPPDPRGAISPSRFRRTLAWHIVRRPRGLVAAAIQYGHVWVQMTQGYAGTLASGFADEIAFERWLARMDEFSAAEEYLDGGGHLSGPGASSFVARTRAANARFAGRTVSTLRQANRLLDDATVQIFAGRGMHCVFDKSKSLCARGGSLPVLSQCKSGCRNLVRTDSDIETLALDLEEIEDLVRTDSGLAPSVRWHRLQAVSNQLEAAIHEHERTRPS